MSRCRGWSLRPGRLLWVALVAQTWGFRETMPLVLGARAEGGNAALRQDDRRTAAPRPGRCGGSQRQALMGTDEEYCGLVVPLRTRG